MTSEEIKNSHILTTVGYEAIGAYLKEIAYQLTVMNEREIAKPPKFEPSCDCLGSFGAVCTRPKGHADGHFDCGGLVAWG